MMTPVKIRVLFLCSANAARSQMAEAILRHLASDAFESYSAGTHPSTVDTRALKILQDADIAIDGLRSKSVDEFAGQYFDYVITLCSKATQECQSFARAGEMIAWDFPDPAAQEQLQAFKDVFAGIQARIKLLIPIAQKHEYAHD